MKAHESQNLMLSIEIDCKAAPRRSILLPNILVCAIILVLFSFKDVSKIGPFFFYVMYFLLYNPNLKSVFGGRNYKYVFFRCCFFMFFLVCLLG